MNTYRIRIRAEHVVGKQNQKKINLIKQVMRKFLIGSNFRLKLLNFKSYRIL